MSLGRRKGFVSFGSDVLLSAHVFAFQRCKTPLDRIGCFDSDHTLIPASELSCPMDETFCSVTSALQGSTCEGGEEYQCAACLCESDSCQVVEGVDTEEECLRLVACEVPGGGIRYDLTEEECLNFGECSSLCLGSSCRSVDDKKGTCIVEGAGEDCGGLGGTMFEGECILEIIETPYACNQVFFPIFFLLGRKSKISHFF